jgi:integrative and conjugative element protein (TIGR02256 family)
MARKTRQLLPDYYQRVYVVESAMQAMARETEMKPGLETGGVLVGFVDSALHAVVVIAASGPGPHAQHGPNTFNRDREHCQAFLDRYVEMTHGVADFVGEWHKHREPDPRPSPTDVQTYRRLAADPACHCALPLVLITGACVISHYPLSEQYVRVNAFVFRRDGYIHQSVRTLLDEAYQDLLIAPL